MSKILIKCNHCDKQADVYKDGRCLACFKKHCSEYQKEYRKKNSERLKEYDKERYRKGISRICLNCGKEFTRSVIGKGFCSRQCVYANWMSSGERKGKNNYGYRNGLYTDVKGKHKSVETLKHLNACRKFRKDFLKKNKELYCEHCKTTDTLKFESHHIVFVSEARHHKELHNFDNIINLCITCHNKFHKEISTRDYIVKKRGLEDVFNIKLIQKDENNTKQKN